MCICDKQCYNFDLIYICLTVLVLDIEKHKQSPRSGKLI